MGNQHSSSSRSTPASSQPQSPVGSSNSNAHAHAHAYAHAQSHAPAQADKHHLPHPGFRTGRRASIQPVTLTQVAPPSASFESAERGRASTQANTTAHVTSQLRAAQDRSIVRDGSFDKMGNEQSSQKKDRDRGERLSRQSTPQPAHTAPSAGPPAGPAGPAPPGHAPSPPANSTPIATATATATTAATFTPQQAKEPSPPAPATTTPTPPPSEVHAIPIDAPHASRTEQAIAGSLEPADASQDYLVPSSHFSRPP